MCWTTAHPDYPASLYQAEQWPGFQTTVKVHGEPRVGDRTAAEERYYIASMPSDAQRALQAAREHWQVENDLFWGLDAAFHEDDSRVRMGNTAQNMTVLRHMALNLIRQQQSTRRSIRGKRLKASWDEQYLARVLCGNQDEIALDQNRMST